MLAAKAAGSSCRSLRQGSSFRSRPQTAQSADGNESQQGVDDLQESRVECWNGGYLETKTQAAAAREQQDWLAHNKRLLHELQVKKHAGLAVLIICMQDHSYPPAIFVQLSGVLCKAAVSYK